MSSFFNLHNSGFWRTYGDIKDDVFLTIFILLNTVLVFFCVNRTLECNRCKYSFANEARIQEGSREACLNVGLADILSTLCIQASSKPSAVIARRDIQD